MGDFICRWDWHRTWLVVREQVPGFPHVAFAVARRERAPGVGPAPFQGLPRPLILRPEHLPVRPGLVALVGKLQPHFAQARLLGGVELEM